MDILIKSPAKFWLIFCLCWGVSEGLFCFTCSKFVCDTDDVQVCKEIQHFPSANNQTRELTENWRNSPQCPEEESELRWSTGFIQNCTEEETKCGSYVLRVTLSVARNSIPEPEYPILVTPTYYYGSIMALGCMPNIERDYDFLGVPRYDVSESQAEENATTTTATTESKSVAKRNRTEIQNAPHVIRNNVKKNKETELADESAVYSYSPHLPLNSSIEPLNLTQDSNSQADQPVALPLIESQEASSEIILPLIMISSAMMKALDEPLCFQNLSHAENRTEYGTLERINIQGQFQTCDYCDRDLCNSEIPKLPPPAAEDAPSEHGDWDSGASSSIRTFSNCIIIFIPFFIFAY